MRTGETWYGGPRQLEGREERAATEGVAESRHAGSPPQSQNPVPAEGGSDDVDGARQSVRVPWQRFGSRRGGSGGGARGRLPRVLRDELAPDVFHGGYEDEGVDEASRGPAGEVLRQGQAVRPARGDTLPFGETAFGLAVGREYGSFIGCLCKEWEAQSGV